MGQTPVAALAAQFNKSSFGLQPSNPQIQFPAPIGPGASAPFSLPLVEELKRRDDDRPCLHVAEPRNLEDAWAAARVVCRSAVDGVDLPASPELVTPELVRYLHDHDKRVAVWVWRAPALNDTPAVWDALSKAGVDAFTSNLPPELIL